MFAPGGSVVPASVKFHASHLNSVQTGTGASLCTTVDFKHSPISGAQTNNISNFYDTFIGWKCLAVNSRTRPHATLVQLLPVCGPLALVFKRKQVQHLTCLNSRGITREQASLFHKITNTWVWHWSSWPVLTATRSLHTRHSQVSQNALHTKQQAAVATAAKLE